MTSSSSPTDQRANFFLVGAPKAGTTSVDLLLRSHPDVFLSPIKEPCHFCPDVVEQIAPALEKIKRITVSSYLASAERDVVHLLPVSSSSDYARLFEGAGNRRVVGECTTFYLSSRDAPRNIHSYNPAARILVLLRNPLDRIRSHYAMDRAMGVTTRPLLSLIEEELALGEAANWGNCRFYVGASRYSEQLREYYRYFPSKNVCVLSFEQLVADPEKQLRQIFSFLEIAVPLGTLTLPYENKSRAARFPKLHKGMCESGLKFMVAGWLRSKLPSRLSDALKSAYYREKTRVVSDEDLRRIEVLLLNEGVSVDPARGA